MGKARIWQRQGKQHKHLWVCPSFSCSSFRAPCQADLTATPLDEMLQASVDPEPWRIDRGGDAYCPFVMRHDLHDIIY